MTMTTEQHAAFKARVDKSWADFDALSEEEKDRQLAGGRCGERLIAGFRPTDADLLAIVRFRFQEELEIHYHGQAGSDESATLIWALRRIGQIAELLGEEPVKKAIKEAQNEFWRGRDPEVRRMFEEDKPAFDTWMNDEERQHPILVGGKDYQPARSRL
jgi:hypothetical protein